MRNFVDYVCTRTSPSTSFPSCFGQFLAGCNVQFDGQEASEKLPFTVRSEWCVLLHAGMSVSKTTCLCSCYICASRIFVFQLFKKGTERRERQNVFNERCNKSCFGRLVERGVAKFSLQIPVSSRRCNCILRSVKWRAWIEVCLGWMCTCLCVCTCCWHNCLQNDIVCSSSDRPNWLLAKIIDKK